MKNLSDRVDIGHGAREEDGTKLEPELQPVVRTIESASGVSLGNDHVGTPLGQSIPLRVTTEMSAIEAAETLSKTCGRCANFRPDLWPAIQREIESTKEGREEMNKIRAAMLDRGPDVIPSMVNGLDEEEIHDVEHALSRFGVCTPLSEMNGAPIASLPESCCPFGHEDLFRPKAGGAARRAVGSVRDRILQLASRRGR